MKYSIAMIAAVFLFSGCTATLNRIDDIIQRGAPYACKQAQSIYGAWIGSNKGSAKDKATVNAAYSGVYELCQSPSTITTVQLIDVGKRTEAMIRAIRSTK